MNKPLTFYWHIHHDILCEETYDIQERIEFIREHKPASEVPLRLKLMVPVKHPELLPEDWKEAYAKREEAYAKWEEAYAKREEAYAKSKEADAKWEEAYAKREEAYAKSKEADAKWKEAYAKREEADAKWEEAYAKREEAYAKRNEADAKRRPELEALHKKEHPDCPWNGITIFP